MTHKKYLSFFGISLLITGLISSPSGAQSTSSPAPKNLPSLNNSPSKPASSSSTKTGPGSGATGESTFQRSKRRESLIAIGSNISMARSVPELREKESDQTLGNIWNGDAPAGSGNNNLNSKNQGQMSYSHFNFGIRASFLSLGPHAAGIFINLPFRQIQKSTENFSTGSEFGGAEIGFDAFSRGIGQFKLSFVDRRSKKLGVLSDHQAVKGSLYFENGGRRRVFSDMLIQLGPEAEISLTKEPSPYATYGNKWGGFAMISADVSLSRQDALRFTIESRFTRIDSYKYKGQERGGAGLGVATPRLEYGMNENLWIGAFYEYPYVKPIGREAHFGEPDLAGLLGPNSGVTLRAEAF